MTNSLGRPSNFDGIVSPPLARARLNLLPLPLLDLGVDHNHVIAVNRKRKQSSSTPFVYTTGLIYFRPVECQAKLATPRTPSNSNGVERAPSPALLRRAPSLLGVGGPQCGG
jgi:hypothetical protein